MFRIVAWTGGKVLHTVLDNGLNRVLQSPWVQLAAGPPVADDPVLDAVLHAPAHNADHMVDLRPLLPLSVHAACTSQHGDVTCTAYHRKHELATQQSTHGPQVAAVYRS